MPIHTLEVRTQPQLCPMPCEDYSVVLDAPGDLSLCDLAGAILDAVGFDHDHAFGFYDNLKNPYRSDESYTAFADEGEGEDENDRGVVDVTIGEVFAKKGKKMIFLFDYGDDWHFLVTCQGIAEGKALKIKARDKSGTPPVQYPDFE